MEKASAKKVTALCSTAPRNDVITKKMVALGNCRKPMPPKPYEGRSDLILGGLLTTASAFLVENHKHYLFRLSWYLARRCPATTPDTQTSTSQYVSVITDHLSCVARWKPPTALAIRTLASLSVVSKFPAPNCLFCTFAFASMIITQDLEICKMGGRNESKVLILHP